MYLAYLPSPYPAVQGEVEGIPVLTKNTARLQIEAKAAGCSMNWYFGVRHLLVRGSNFLIRQRVLLAPTGTCSTRIRGHTCLPMDIHTSHKALVPTTLLVGT